MNCIEPDNDTGEIEVRDLLTAFAHRANETAIRATEIAILTYKADGVWINPVQVKEAEFSLQQAMASVRHIMRSCGIGGRL